MLIVLSGCEGPGFAPIRDNVPLPAKTKPSAKPAPVVQALPQQTGQHVVQAGDTLFSIAFVNGLDYRDIAVWNNLESPDIIKIGQVLRLTPPEGSANRIKGVETVPLHTTSLSTPKPIAKPIPDGPPLITEPRALRLPYSEANWKAVTGIKAAVVADVPKTPPQAQPTQPAPALPQPAESPQTSPASKEAEEGWRWPAEGNVLGTFGQGGGKGIDIAGTRNSPVLAAAPGKVVYSGTGLRGYGKMLIVKHADEFLTAYAHNQNLLVTEGVWVKAGQKIAEMGDTESERVKLHFEVRQFGKPLDPLKYLPERK